MKKQILSLILIVFSLFFGVNATFGQELDYVTGTPAKLLAVTLNCATAAGELNPLPGVTYNYAITTDVATVASVHWFVTDESQVIRINTTTGLPELQPLRDPRTGGEYILLAEDVVYDNAANLQKDIDISWQWFNGTTNEVLVVAYVKGAAGCSDNVEVWRIEPTFQFTLDVISMYGDGTLGTTAAPAEECVSPVQSATYDGTNLTMDYGQNYVFFTVTAANFAHSWMSTMTASSTTGATTAIQWAYPAQANSAAGTWNALTVPIEAQATGGVVAEAGEAIVVRVLVDHGNIELPVGATEATVTLFVDGIMYDAANLNYLNPALADLDEPTTGTACVNNVTDEADYILLPRPLITESNPAAPTFEPKN